MKKFTLMTLFAFLAGLLGSAPALAAGEVELKATAQEEVTVIAEDGTETKALVPADKVVPGDVVVYTITAKNVSDQPVESIVINDPIPVHMTYVIGSVTNGDTEITFSVDGGETFAPASELEVTDESGSPRAVEAKDYTHIRWTLVKAIPPSGEKSVSFRARLN